MTDALSDRPEERAGDVVSAPAPKRRRWVGPTLAVIAVVAVGLGSWLIMDSRTVPNEDYDEVRTQLEAAEAELQVGQVSVAELNAELETATTEIVALGGERDAASAEVAVLEEEQAVLQGRIAATEMGVEQAKTAVIAILFNEMYLNDDFFRELSDAGFDPSVGDRLMEFMESRWSTIEEYAGSYAIPSWGSAVEEVGDPVAQEAFETWLNTPVGSPEESVAYVELRWHLFRVVMDGMEAATATAGD